MEVQNAPTRLDLIEDSDIIAWIMNHGIVTERGLPISFEQHAFMMDPYRDWSPWQGVRKASQCGWSVMTNLKLFWAAKFGIPGYDIPAANVIYTLPSEEDVNAFVPSKTNYLIKNNPVLEGYMRGVDNKRPDVDSISRKAIGKAMMYFKGTRSKTAAIMLTSDLNIHDEADRSEQGVIQQYQSRLTSSKYKGRWIFSNPSTPFMPADSLFLRSDQKHWFIKCNHCGYPQYLEWYKLSEHEFVKGTNHCYVDDVNKQYICGKCMGTLTDENRMKGKWFAKWRGKEISGYWVSQMMYPWISARELIETEQDPDKGRGYFMNMVLGLPYTGSDVRVTEETIVANMVMDQIPSMEELRGKCGMGIDNGDIKTYGLAYIKDGKRHLFKLGRTRKWEDIEFLIKQYDPYFIIDLNPYPDKPREIVEKYRPGNGKLHRGWLSFYKEQSLNYDLVDWGENENGFMVYPVRNAYFDDLIGRMVEGQWKYVGAKTNFRDFIDHWLTMSRVDMIGSQVYTPGMTGNPGQIVQGKWVSSNGMDHFCHMLLYLDVVLSRVEAGHGKVITQTSDPKALIEQATRQPVKRAPVIVQKEEGVVQVNTKPIAKASVMAKPRPKTGGSASGNS